MPQPPSSTQPVPEHTVQPLPSQNTHVMANSADGSVNGKNDGRKRALMSGPKSAWMNASIVPSRSPSVMPWSTARPSIWWNTGEWRASSVSRRNARPGITHVDRRALRLHHAHLHRRGVRAQQHLFGLAQLHVERVLHGAGRVAGREVERLEVVPVGLDLGALGHLVAQADEHVFELAPDACDRMEVAAAVAAPAGGEIEPIVHERRGARVGARARRGAARPLPRARRGPRRSPCRAAARSDGSTFLTSCAHVVER